MERMKSAWATDSPRMYPGVVLQEKIDMGGQARVYKARWKGRTVAVKVFQRYDGLDDLRTELKTLDAMGPHRNVTERLTYFEKPKPALVLRYYDGADLMDRLRARRYAGRTLSYGRVLRYALGLARGLAHMHRHGVVHRDFKSNNCVIDDVNDEAVIIDFGLCAFRDEPNFRALGRTAKERKTERERSDRERTARIRQAASEGTLVVNPVKTNHVKGTPYWIAPEMIRSKKWDERSDVYSYAIVLWELNTCKMPYQTATLRGIKDRDLLQHISNGVRPSRGALEEAKVPGAMRRLIEKCWDRDILKRPSMRRVVEQLEALKKEHSRSR